MHFSAAAENTCSAPKKLLIKSLFDLESTLEFSTLLQQDFSGLFPAGDSSPSTSGGGCDSVCPQSCWSLSPGWSGTAFSVSMGAPLLPALLGRGRFGTKLHPWGRMGWPRD